jgi:prepilin-type processing-associated H-X9-DG protein
MRTRPERMDPPLEQDGEFLWSFGGGVRRVCTNRHDGGVNILFMDWSIDKAGLKELWRFKWHRSFDTANAWATPPGVLPEDRPLWMRNFKHYSLKLTDFRLSC